MCAPCAWVRLMATKEEFNVTRRTSAASRQQDAIYENTATQRHGPRLRRSAPRGRFLEDERFQPMVQRRSKQAAYRLTLGERDERHGAARRSPREWNGTEGRRHRLSGRSWFPRWRLPGRRLSRRRRLSWWRRRLPWWRRLSGRFSRQWRIPRRYWKLSRWPDPIYQRHSPLGKRSARTAGFDAPRRRP